MDIVQSDWLLFTLLFIAFLLCGFCAASETGMMSLNRYRLRHLAKTDSTARRIMRLLAHPDKLLGVILIGNTFAVTIATSLATQLMENHWGEIGILLAPIILTLLLLVFAEVTPKTLAALKPEPTARFVVLPLQILLWLLYPLVFMANLVSNALLQIFGIKVKAAKTAKTTDSLTSDELRTVVNEANSLLPSRHQSMLLSILDLEKTRVDHIMIPRSEVIGINLDDDFTTIIAKLKSIQHTLLPVYRSDLDNVVGILHARNIVNVLAEKELNEHTLMAAMEEPYFVPEGTSLHTQLLNFQHNKRRMALVVDEYGDILGLVTLEDILEEIVGEFTTDVTTGEQDVRPQEDGSFLVDGSASLRELNRTLHWELPIDGPTTLNGLIIEKLEAIPTVGTCVLIAEYPIEVLEMKENMVKVARISPKMNAHAKHITHE